MNVINNYDEFKSALREVKPLNLKKLQGKDSETKFFIELINLFIKSEKVNFTEAQEIEALILLKNKGIVSDFTYHKAHNTRPNPNLFQTCEQKTTDFPVSLFSTIVYGDEKNFKDCRDAFFKEDCGLTNLWLETNKLEVKETIQE